MKLPITFSEFIFTRLVALILIASVFTTSANASKLNTDYFSTSLEFAQVVKVVATQRPSGSWCFETSIRHNDQGWKHYANEWEVIDLDGKHLGSRRLGHPHDSEQPFTRGQCGIKIPENTVKVIVRAKCNQHGFGGKVIVVNLNADKGKGYSVNKVN